MVVVNGERDFAQATGPKISLDFSLLQRGLSRYLAYDLTLR